MPAPEFQFLIHSAFAQLAVDIDQNLQRHRAVSLRQHGFLVFDSRVGFSGTAYLTASFKFTSDLPLLPWQRNLAQNRL